MISRKKDKFTVPKPHLNWDEGEFSLKGRWERLVVVKVVRTCLKKQPNEIQI